MFISLLSWFLFPVVVHGCDRIHNFYSVDSDHNHSETSNGHGNAVLLTNPLVKSAACTEYTVSGTDDKLSWTYDDSKTGLSGVCSPTDKCGPSSWHKISAASGVNQCGGQSQTPIDIVPDSVTGQYPEDITFSVTDGGCSTWTSFTDDHVVEVSFSETNEVCSNHAITVGGKTYTLKQFHFHTPSEHTIDGEDAAAEMHFVHKTASGEAAVLGVLLQSSDKAKNADVISHIAEMVGAVSNSAPAEGSVLHCKNLETGKVLNAYSFLPDVKDFYAYSGSLTTYPCTEGISWFVYKKPMPISAFDVSVIRESVKAYSKSIASPQGDDARPVQPLNGRPILEFKAPKQAKAPKTGKGSQEDGKSAKKTEKAPKKTEKAA